MKVDNFKRAEELFKAAKDIYGEMEQDYKRENWNLTIRRAQESAELSLKSILKAINIEFPKEHDVGRFVVDILKNREIEIEKAEEKNLILFSKELTEDRLPSFYFEKFYTKDEAKEAIEKASWILKFTEELLDRLKGGS
jgi:HEPN domain-containing protein